MKSKVELLESNLETLDCERDNVLEELLVAKHELATLVRDAVQDCSYQEEESTSSGSHTIALRATTESGYRGNAYRFTNDTITEYFGIIDDFSLAGNRISELFHRILQFFTGWSTEEVKTNARLPGASQMKEHFKVMGRAKQAAMNGARNDALPFFGAEADEGTTFSANIGWTTLHWLWFTGDSASSMLAAGELAHTHKVLVFAEKLASPGFSYPTFMPPDVQLFFLVHESDPSTLVPLHGPFYVHDACHIPKNGEAAMIRELGAGVNMGSGKVGYNFFKCELFRFARLHKLSHEFRDLMRQHCVGSGKEYKTIPAEINHRLKILTRLSEAYDEFREEIGELLEEFNFAYGDGHWKGDRQPLLDHMKEVMASTHDVRMVAWTKLNARLHSWAQEVYTSSQCNSGFNMCIMRRLSAEHVRKLRNFHLEFETLFEDELAEILDACETAEDDGILEHMAKLTVAALNKRENSEPADDEGDPAEDSEIAHLESWLGDDLLEDDENDEDVVGEVVDALLDELLEECTLEEEAVEEVERIDQMVEEEDARPLYERLIKKYQKSLVEKTKGKTGRSIQAPKGAFQFALANGYTLDGMSASQLLVCDFRRGLQVAADYIQQRFSFYTEMPYRIHSYFDPITGFQNFLEDYSILQTMPRTQFLVEGWFHLGFWEHPAHAAGIRAIVANASGAAHPTGAACWWVRPLKKFGIPGGVANLGESLLAFFERYLLVACSENMPCERKMGHAKRIGVGGTIDELRTFERLHEAKVVLTEAMRKDIGRENYKKRKADTVKDAGEHCKAFQIRKDARLAELAEQDILAADREAQKAMDREVQQRQASQREELARLKEIANRKRDVLKGMNKDECYRALTALGVKDITAGRQGTKVDVLRRLLLPFVDDEGNLASAPIVFDADGARVAAEVAQASTPEAEATPVMEREAHATSQVVDGACPSRARSVSTSQAAMARTVEKQKRDVVKGMSKDECYRALTALGVKDIIPAKGQKWMF
ncbi:hypothetical protein CYMTET_22101 [Cymbomonas tetramitiformis]|uniref:Uncharacterized protein n=1 Tax=Cymbomonas tetramitiformis TaxID=36881 RepID=A0AAE0G0S6_9CHLO|nr:hypothetical protein CYMTET_22101 [Cymbomonas tetramitiformis]